MATVSADAQQTEASQQPSASPVEDASPQETPSSSAKSKVKAPAWSSEEDLALTIAARTIPDASIDGSSMPMAKWGEKMRDRMLELCQTDMTNPRTWGGRSGRACVSQWRKIHAACLNLHGCWLRVEKVDFTGSPSDDDRMRMAIGLNNDQIQPSHFYDVVRNPRYLIGDPFPYEECYEWLRKNTDWLQPRFAFSSGSAGKKIEGSEPPDKKAEDVGECRPEGNKKAKERKRKAAQDGDVAKEIKAVGDAIVSFGTTYETVETAKANAKAESEAKRFSADVALKKRKCDMETFRVLFGEDSGAPAQQRQEYGDLLRLEVLQEKQRQLQSSYPYSSGAQNTDVESSREINASSTVYETEAAVPSSDVERNSRRGLMLEDMLTQPPRGGQHF